MQHTFTSNFGRKLIFGRFQSNNRSPTNSPLEETKHNFNELMNEWIKLLFYPSRQFGLVNDRREAGVYKNNMGTYV